MSSADAASRFAWPAAFVIVSALGFVALRSRPEAPASSAQVAHEGPTVVRELRALSRLETLALHVEKVIDVKDHQTHAQGLVEADDSLLFVASGEVVLGVDLAKISDGDVSTDPQTKVVTITMPPPEVLSTRFDEVRSYVHSRSTDLLARRNEGLEGIARRDAVQAFEKAAREPAAMDRAHEQAERQVRALATAWGARSVVVQWKAAAGELRVESAPPSSHP
jgi:hypothetical protein